MATASPGHGRFFKTLQCPICLKMLKKPKVLPCGHTYCAACLRSHIIDTATHRGTKENFFLCPVCGADTIPSDSSESVDKWAEMFPVNSIISSLSDITFGNNDKFCDPCLKWERETKAGFFCKDCNKSMCNICKEYHDEISSVSSHTTIDVYEMTESQVIMRQLSVINLCPQHPTKQIELFCNDHSKLCCNTCVLLEHKKCETLITVDDLLKTINLEKTTKEVAGNLNKLTQHLQTILDKVQVSTDSIRKDKSGILQQVRDLEAQINTKLQKLVNDITASLEGIHRAEELNLQSQDARGQRLIAAINSDQANLDLVMTHGTDVQKVITFYNMDQNQHKYLNTIAEYQEGIKKINLVLEIHGSFREKFMNEMGTITVIRTNSDLQPCRLVKTLQHILGKVGGSCGTPLKDRKAMKVFQFNIRELGDVLSCEISDILRLPDKRLVLLDFRNHSIKVYGDDYQFLECRKFEYGPWNACILSNNTMAVTIPWVETIQVIRIDDKMHSIKVIRMSVECWGISVLKDQFMITTYGDEHSVMILDMDGKEIWIVRPSEENQLYSTCVCGFATTIYIPDDCWPRIVAYNTDYQEMAFNYTDEDWTKAAGVDSDREGNIYLCNYYLHCIQQISADGRLIKTLISTEEEEKKPLSIKFDRDIDRFFVTYAGCDVVEIYDLSI